MPYIYLWIYIIKVISMEIPQIYAGCLRAGGHDNACGAVSMIEPLCRSFFGLRPVLEGLLMGIILDPALRIDVTMLDLY